ncbi:MAG: hypothetical protein FWE31_05090 [Firmicutes bacterium]|nr:hypothetical protein [Bacillota bacterium]
MKIGLHDSQALVNMAISDHDPSTVRLNPGHLQGQQLRNFGTTPIWQWGGSWSGRGD